MKTPDFRALCAELAAELRLYKIAHPMHEESLLDRARAALAEEAVGPSDEELLELMPQSIRDDFAAASRYAAAEAGVKPGIFRVTLNTHALAFARAVLARYGSAPRPIPVAERLPGAEDCDAEGRCWICVQDPPGFTSWSFFDYRDAADWVRRSNPSWLPAQALPIPENADG